MLRHQFGQNFVLGLDFFLQELDPFLLLLDLTGGTLLRLEGGGSVLEELLLPAIEDGGLQSIFLTQLGNWGPCLRGVASGWLPSLLRCSACARFSYVLSAILAKERLLHFQLRRDRMMGLASE